MNLRAYYFFQFFQHGGNNNLSLLVNHRLIAKLIEINADNKKGTPVFIEP